MGSGSAFAQVAWPKAQTIKFIVPFTPGSGTDVIARLLANRLADTLETSIFVENKPGAGGTIGAALVAKAEPNGYTFLIQSSGHVVNPALYSNLPYDTLKDFAGVTTLAELPNVMVTSPDSGYTSVKDLITKAQAAPGMKNYASAGNGTISHLLGAMLNTSAGIEMQHIPYKGVAPAINDVLGGQVPLAFASLPSALNYIKAGKLQAIAISSAKRSSAAPEIPTIAETYPDCVGEVWVALFAPIGTSADAVKKVQLAMDKIMVKPDVREKLIAQGLDLNPVPAAKLSGLLKEELAKWAKIVKASGAQLD